MAKELVLAEKPSVARDIARVLKCNKNGNGYIEGDKYIVTWALGHLVTLADPEKYNAKYKTWNMDDLPMIPNEMELIVIKETSRQYNTVKEQLLRKDVTGIVIATDAGREGELVARWIIEKAKVRKPMKRLWISSVTDKAIKDGFATLRDARLYENLYQSAIARAEADWLVGINATRALTCKHNAQLSCGRVQTPTLSIIAGREDEIRNFKPRSYYGIKVVSGKLNLTWQESKTKDNKTFDKEYCDKIVQGLNGKPIQITEVEKSQKKSFAPALYDLTELQRDANKMYGYTAKETLSIMQRLYESYKLLTYPRTDARYISTDIVPTLKDRVKACSFGEFSKFANKIALQPIKGNSHFVDNAKVSDHHAIIPTEVALGITKLSEQERKIYLLVVKRFLSVLLPLFEYEQTTIRAKIGGEEFTARGKVVTVMGWKEVYNNSYVEDADTEEDDQLLPKVNKGDILKIDTLKQTNGQTKPPAYFNEATLLSAMENPAKYMNNNDKVLTKTLGETGGLGTVATRADIIDKLFHSFLLEKRGKDIFITSKGKQLLELVPSGLRSPEMTAQWEVKLSSIAKGQVKRLEFIKDIKKYTMDSVQEIRNSSTKFKHDNISGEKCPTCGKPMLEVNGKKGKMLVCQDRDCGFRKSVAIVTNARCPECHKKLELRGQGEGQLFTCKCGYREKLSAFENRKKSEGTQNVSKKDVAQYLNSQKKEKESVNNAFANAFAKLNEKK